MHAVPFPLDLFYVFFSFYTDFMQGFYSVSWIYTNVQFIMSACSSKIKFVQLKTVDFMLSLA